MLTQQEIKQVQARVTLDEMLNGLSNVRLGALLYQARPDLGDLLLDLTSPHAPDDADAELFDSAASLSAITDQLLQAVIGGMESIQRWLEEDTS
ncbi:hypothetical protein LCGC14_1946630 [marine sediment metagenome]|uniref:Uncharacterized protein n=1 Tax=marine sediment metagenome TaxID=412755 RepID=A0A0F9G751_9ZZZZ